MNTVVLDESYAPLIADFDCGDEGLNNYLKEKALEDYRKNEATTTLVVKKYRSQLCLLGYYTLKNTSLLFRPDQTLRGYPAIEIMYLAVQRNHQRKGIGTRILRGIIYRAYQLSREFSAVTVLILSSKKCAAEFYKKNSFQELAPFLDMLYDPCRAETIALFLNLNFEF